MLDPNMEKEIRAEMYHELFPVVRGRRLLIVRVATSKCLPPTTD